MSLPLAAAVAVPLSRLSWRVPRRVPVLGAIFGALAGSLIACGLVRLFSKKEAG